MNKFVKVTGEYDRRESNESMMTIIKHCSRHIDIYTLITKKASDITARLLPYVMDFAALSTLMCDEELCTVMKDVVSCLQRGGCRVICVAPPWSQNEGPNTSLPAVIEKVLTQLCERNLGRWPVYAFMCQQLRYFTSKRAEQCGSPVSNGGGTVKVMRESSE